MSNSKTTGYQAIPRDAKPEILVDTINRIVLGKINVTFQSFTLATNATTTTLTDPRIGPNSFIYFMPTTSNAASALSTTYVSARTKGSATVTHANNAQADRTFTVLIIG